MIERPPRPTSPTTWPALGRRIGLGSCLALFAFLPACHDGSGYHGHSAPVAAESRADGGSRSARNTAPEHIRRWTADLGSSSAEPESRSEVYALPGMACLVNELGFRVKVLPRDRGVRCMDRAPGGRLVGSPLRQFQPYFVFDVTPSTGEPAFYKVGSTPRKDSIVGWAPASRVARWDSRVGVRYRRIEGERLPPLLVYSDPQPLVEILEQGETEAQPIARAKLDADHTLMPWPVAETKQVTVDGRVYELVRLNFLGEFSEGAEGAGLEPEGYEDLPEVYSDAEVQTILDDVSRLDLVFCLDNTHSTGPYLESMRQAVREIAAGLGDRGYLDLNVGLVLYRDYVDGLLFHDGQRPSVTRHYGLSGDVDGLLDRVRDLEEASITSDGFPEAGYDGLMAALTETPWRGGALAARAVVLIGDNSFHPPGDPKNPRNIGVENVQRAADEIGAQVFALNISGRGGRDEQREHERQFQAIAESCGGECFDIDDASRVVNSIRQVSGSQMAMVETRAKVTDYLARGESAERIAAEHALDIHQVTEVMEFLEGAGIEVDKLGSGKPSFATGWALVEIRAAQILEREVYVARNELDVLLSALTQLRSRLSGSTNFGEAAGQISFLAHADPMWDFFSGNAAEDLDVFLMAKGVPTGRNSILRLSSTDVQHMTEDARRILHDRIARYSIPSLTNALNDDSLWTHRDVHEFGWVLEELLP